MPRPLSGSQNGQSLVPATPQQPLKVAKLTPNWEEGVASARLVSGRGYGQRTPHETLAAGKSAVVSRWTNGYHGVNQCTANATALLI